MAQNSSSKKSEGLCQKLQNAVSPFRPRIQRVSDQPRGSDSVACDKNSVKNTSPQSKPVHVLHQSITIPVEFKHSTSHFSNSNTESDEKEIAIVRGQKFAKSASRKEQVVPPPHHVHLGKARSAKDEDDHSVHECKFSDYISNFKNRMMKTASHVGGGGGDKVTNLTLKNAWDESAQYFRNYKALILSSHWIRRPDHQVFGLVQVP